MKEPLLSIRGLRFQYPSGQRALDGVDLKVEAGEKVAILGPNGAGKSTLILHLNGLLRGDGEVRVAGQVVEKRTLREIRRKVGVVFQDPDDQLFCPTLEQDIVFGPRNFGVLEPEVQRRKVEVLELLNLEHLMGKAPFQMSFGERKRAALATVLACAPDLMVLDEPSSNLDPRHRRRLIGWIRAHGGTILLATHDLDLALETTSRSVLLTGGRVVADGASREILADKSLLESHGLELPLVLQGGLEFRA